MCIHRYMHTIIYRYIYIHILYVRVCIFFIHSFIQTWLETSTKQLTRNASTCYLKQNKYKHISAIFKIYSDMDCANPSPMYEMYTFLLHLLHWVFFSHHWSNLARPANPQTFSCAQTAQRLEPRRFGALLQRAPLGYSGHNGDSGQHIATTNTHITREVPM